MRRAARPRSRGGRPPGAEQLRRHPAEPLAAMGQSFQQRHIRDPGQAALRRPHGRLAEGTTIGQMDQQHPQERRGILEAPTAPQGPQFLGLRLPPGREHPLHDGPIVLCIPQPLLVHCRPRGPTMYPGRASNAGIKLALMPWRGVALRQAQGEIIASLSNHPPFPSSPPRRGYFWGYC